MAHLSLVTAVNKYQFVYYAVVQCCMYPSFLWSVVRDCLFCPAFHDTAMSWKVVQNGGVEMSWKVIKKSWKVVQKSVGVN